MRKQLAAATIAVSAALLAACGSSSDGSSDGNTGESNAPSASGSSEAPATIEKKVGEQGGWNCESKDNATCSVAFTVTSITPVPTSQCTSASDVPEGTKLYKVAIDVQGNHPVPPPNSHIPPGFVVASDNWYGLGSDGYTTKAEVAIGCGDYTPGPFYEHVAVGRKQRGTIIFALPENSIALELRVDGLSWEWKL